MRKDSGIAHLFLVIVVAILLIVVGVPVVLKSVGRDLPPAPWERNEQDAASLKDDPCGNDIGNGAEIISGPKYKDLRKEIDIDNPFRSLTVHPTNPDIVYVGTERNGILKTEDGGKSWERLRYGIRHHDEFNAYPEVYDMAIAASNPDVVYAAITEGPGPLTGNFPTTYGGVHISKDGGKTWQRKNCGLDSGAVLSVWVDPKDEDNALIGLDQGEVSFTHIKMDKDFYEGGLYETQDGGESWKPITIGGEEVGGAYIQIKNSGTANNIYSFGSYNREGTNPNKNVGFVMSADNGKTWSKIYPNVRSEFVSYFDVGLEENYIYAVVRDSGVWVSGDGGINWTTQLDRNSIYIPTADPGDPQKVLFGMMNDLHITKDGFKSHEVIINRPTQDSKHASDIVFSQSNPKIVYAIFVGLDLYKSTDGGESFIYLLNLRKDVLDKIP